MPKLDLNKIAEDLKLVRKESKEKEKENIPRSYSPELFRNEYKVNYLELQSEVTDHYEDGRKKREIFKNKDGQVIVERDYYRNKRYIEKVYYPDGSLYSTQIYNADGTPGKAVGAKKKIIKEKKVVGFYATQELDEKITEFVNEHRSISKSDLINFCLHYTFEQLEDDIMVEHIKSFKDYLERMGY